MRILLPPSEGKTAPTSGPSLTLDSLAFPELTATREQVLAALERLCRDDPDQALSRLGLGRSLSAEVGRNAELLDQPCAPAWQIYTGVLFGALDLGSLPEGASTESLLIASALFGLLDTSDLIPAYRLSGSVTLPGMPSPKRVWGGPLAATLTGLSRDHLIIDLRSQTYAGWFTMRSPNWVTVRVMTLRNGRRVPVSHHNKATKGLLARALISSAELPGDAVGLVDLLQSLRWQASATPDGIIDVIANPE